MPYLQYKKVSYHKGLRDDPARIQLRGKSKCPRMTESEAEALLNRGYREEVDDNGYPARVYVEHRGVWYRAKGGKEGLDGPFYHAFPIPAHTVPYDAKRRSKEVQP